MVDNTILDTLYEHVLNTPDRTAIKYESENRLTFKEYWTVTGRIYAWLKSRRIGTEDVVMYCLPRGTDLYACMIGTIRAGAAFVLAETGNDKRTDFIRKDCNCKLFVDESLWEEIKRTEPIDGYETSDLHSLCYIAYTSGTTGNPKGVMHEYGTLINAWKSAILNGVPILAPEDTYSVMSPICFVSMPIIVGFSSVFGNAVAIVPYEYCDDSESFAEYLCRNDVNCGYLTPSRLRKLLPLKKSLKTCVLSSEPADGLYLDGTRCINCYASTESGCLLTLKELTHPQTPAPVGKPQSDVEILILDENGKEVPAGYTGEVCFRDPFVRGYLNLPELTRKKINGTIIHSGDAGMMTSDGDLVICGRFDEMFKINGYRIEPDEVGNAVRQVSGIKNLVVRGFVYKDISSIIVFYTGDIIVDEVMMRQKLLDILPEYMIPTNYIHLEEFPLLETGKTDKRSLYPPEGSWDEFRKQESSDLQIIGQGRKATVYAIGSDKVIKLYKQSVPYERIRLELEHTRIAYGKGLPVPKAYEMVRSDTRYGVMFDRLGGTVIEEAIRCGIGNCQELIKLFAGTVKSMHKISMSDESIQDLKGISLSCAQQIDHAYCNEEEIQKISDIIASIPDSDHFVHGDCHPGNAMIFNDGIKFIDLVISGKGDPVFDHLCMYSHCVFLPSFMTDEQCVAKLGVDKLKAGALFDVYLKSYYPDIEDKVLSDMKERIRGIHAARICIASVILPGVFTDEELKEARRRSLEYWNGHLRQDGNGKHQSSLQ
ncbi:MAG: AMP-binding protein [Clostridiales bacterium]|nr:AMP-binding protein [Clostridiales bacterium]